MNYTLQELEEHRAAWIAALKSGEYRQGFGFLHNKDLNVFCCLGVGCDLMIKRGVEEFTSFTSEFKSHVEYNGKSGNPPREMQQYFGINTSDVEDLVELNDTEKKTFQEIANFIKTLPVRIGEDDVSPNS